MYKLGVIGLGNMGGAIVRGILESETFDPKEITIFEKNKEKVEDLLEKGINLSESEEDLIKNSKNILLAIKPQGFKKLGKALSGNLEKESTLISIAAGITLKDMEEIFSHKKVIRVMPNTPALIRKGMTAISPSENVDDKDIEFVKEIFGSVGGIAVMDENYIDAFQGLAGCMPAFVYMFIEAAADSGVKNGLKRQDAYKFVSQALVGSAEMVLKTGKHPGELKDQVTSPGGTTIKGVVTLEEEGFRNAIIKAVDASTNGKIDL